MKILMNLAVMSNPLSNKRMSQQPRSTPPSRRFSLQTPRNKIPKLRRGRYRRLRRRSHTNSTHQASPIPLPTNRKRKPSHVELQDANPKAPYITGISIVLTVVDVGVDPLRTHVRDRSNGGIARIHRLVQDPTYSEVSDLDLLARVDEEVRRLDVAVDDVAAVEVRESTEDLAS